QVVAADREVLAHSPRRARRLLDECAASQRRFEWHYLMARCGGAAPYRKLPASARCRPVWMTNTWAGLARPEGAGPGTLRLSSWDGDSLGNLSAGGLSVQHLVEDPDDHRLALIAAAGPISIRHGGTGREEQRLDGHPGGTRAAVFVKGKKQLL